MRFFRAPGSEIEVRKEVVALLNLAERRLVDLPGIELVHQTFEIGQVIDEAKACVCSGCPGGDQEGPVARPGQQQLAARLAQGARRGPAQAIQAPDQIHQDVLGLA